MRYSSAQTSIRAMLASTGFLGTGLLVALLFMLPLAAASAAAQGPQLVTHRLEVRLDPAAHELRVLDTINLGDQLEQDAEGGYRLVLHAGLEPEVAAGPWRLEPVEGEVRAGFFGINATTETVRQPVPLEGFRLIREPGAEEDAGTPGGTPAEVTLRYGGPIDHQLATQGEEYQRSFSETPGIIDERGVFLAGTSFWVPTFGDGLVRFELEARELVPPWDVVSQGERIVHRLEADGSRTTSWRLDEPTEEIYLVAGPWHAYSAEHAAGRHGGGTVAIHAFLREDDPALADRYLQATGRYLELYESMLPAFPYRSFSLVENFWETGYGMPGFTLLGPRVIRFPWILTSSYPHELLHNWWGNGVLVDVDRGNWCEGLTAYMADHLFAEQRGEAAVYRRSTLKKYTDFVSAGNDLPLVEFTSRRSAATEAVGYGKSLMLFHMIRRAVGDEVFLQALSSFYDTRSFTRAGFDDLGTTFDEVAGGGWSRFIETWTERAGAPVIKISSLDVSRQDDPSCPWQVKLQLRQTGVDEPFPMTLPVAVVVEDRDEPIWAEAGSCESTCSLVIPCPSRPLRLDVDPMFDVMRRLDPMEVPPALSTVLGAEEPLYVLPASASEPELDAWRALAAAWAGPGGPTLVLDSELDVLPEGPAWVLGQANRFGPELLGRLERQGVTRSAAGTIVGGELVPPAGHSLVLVARDLGDPGVAAAWIAADPVEAIPGLARKLPHYSKYSYLVFRGGEPESTAKGMWQAVASPLVRNLSSGALPLLTLPERRPLAELPAVFDAGGLDHAVAVLAGPEMEGRGLGSEGLERATAWVEQELGRIGLEPAGDGGFRQQWRWHGGEPEQDMTLTNLVARIPGSDPALADQPVLLMAHLDHLGRGWPDVRSGNEGEIHPGADDNASGVAVLLEVARALAAEPHRPRPVLVAVLTGEEAGLLGSRHLVTSLLDQAAAGGSGARPFACINLDTVGRLGDGELLVLNADSAREWRFIFMGVGYTTGAPIKVVSERLDASDQTACLDAGVPAVQLFTGPNADYHRPSDTADRIDGDGMATVAEATHEAAAYLAERLEPLTVQIAAGGEQGSAPVASASAGASAGAGAGTRAGGPPGPRRASLGTMPDFGFDGPGVRVQQVMPGSAAEAAGILAGDVVVAVGTEPISDLRSYSAVLKALAPGDEVDITIVRDGDRLVLQATLGAR